MKKELNEMAHIPGLYYSNSLTKNNTYELIQYQFIWFSGVEHHSSKNRFKSS